jgi:uncharacterized iron-regulated membrane protein
MASSRTLNMLFTIHSWAGVVTGLLMFVVCFSGAVVVFKHEIDLWANPVLGQAPRAEVPAALDTVYTQALAAPGARAVELIALPDDINPAFTATVQGDAASADTRVKLALRADDGALIAPVDSELGQYLRSLHVFLFFGPRWIVGFLGVAMLVLIATGIVIHRKIIAELFTQRWDRSLRVLFSDLHKAAGVWGLAFHILIAFTGAWLGLAPVFERGFDYLSKPAPVAAAIAPAMPKPAPAKMRSLDTLKQTARDALPSFEVRVVALRQWGTQRATARFAGRLQGSIFSTAHVVVNAASGAVVSVHDPRQAGFWSKVNALMEPLHFGDFGGLSLKWLYFLLGLTPAFLSLSGTLIWLDRRRQRALGRERAGEPMPQGS